MDHMEPTVLAALANGSGLAFWTWTSDYEPGIVSTRGAELLGALDADELARLRGRAEEVRRTGKAEEFTMRIPTWGPWCVHLTLAADLVVGAARFL